MERNKKRYQPPKDLDSLHEMQDKARRKQIENCPERLLVIAEESLGTTDDPESLEARIFNLRTELWYFEKGTPDYITCQTALNIGILKARDQFGVTYERIGQILEEADRVFRMENPQHESVIFLTE